MKLTVRTTTGTSCEIDCDPEITIAEFKKLIEETHELKPKPDEQRLVCGGKLGRNDQTVKSFIENSTVIHLIYTNKNPKKDEENKKDKETKSEKTENKETGNKCRRRYKVNDEYQKQLRKEVQEFMAWKGIEKHPYLNIRVDKDELIRKSNKPEVKKEAVDQNNNVESTPSTETAENAEENAQNEQPENEPAQNNNPAPQAPQAPAAPAAPAAAEDEGFRIDWFDRIFYLIQMSFFGLMIFARTAMGSWWMFGAICIALKCDKTEIRKIEF